jgi:hypothetical protein
LLFYLIKSKKNPDLYYTIASIKSGTTDSIAFATPANPSINFNGNNIILGGISDASSSSVSLLANAANAGYFVNGSMFATKAPSIYVPTKPVLSLKIVTGLVENFGSVIKYCDEADKKIGECTTSELNVASLALVSL